MKYFKLTIVLVGIIASFVFFDENISNYTVNKLIKNDFRIDARFCGCFGCGTQTATVYKKGSKRWMELGIGNFPNQYESRITEFTPEKEKQLDSLIMDAIENQRMGGCTSTYEYRLENNSFGIKFTDSRCSINHFLDKITLDGN